MSESKLKKFEQWNELLELTDNEIYPDWELDEEHVRKVQSLSNLLHGDSYGRKQTHYSAYDIEGKLKATDTNMQRLARKIKMPYKDAVEFSKSDDVITHVRGYMIFKDIQGE